MALIEGTNGRNTLKGTSGNDTIYGYGGDDVLLGGYGYNSLWGGSGKDVFGTSARSANTSQHQYVEDFQDGTDRVDVSAWGVTDFSQLKALLTTSSNGSATVNAYYGGVSHQVTLDNIGLSSLSSSDFTFAAPTRALNTTGTTSADTMFGTRFGDILRGDAGNDVLLGGAGNDSLNGGTGNDTLIGGTGRDGLNGDSGFDYASYAGATARVTADLTTAANNTGDAAGDTYSSIEGLIGTTFGDSLRGNSSANILNGGAGDDFLYGRSGDDTLIGGSGTDVLYGESGKDTLRGDSGNDWLYGGTGKDTLTGGTGADAFVFRSANEAGFGSSGRDVITDFVRGQDHIDLREMDITLQDVVQTRTSTGVIIGGDSDGDGYVDFEIQLNGVSSVDGGDFWFR